MVKKKLLQRPMTMDGEMSESVQQTISRTAHHASIQRSDLSTLPIINTL